MTVERDLIEVVNDMSSTRSDVVAAYAAAILVLKDGPLMVGEPWADVNSTIVERWDKQELREIKREAWDIVENKPPSEERR